MLMIIMTITRQFLLIPVQIASNIIIKMVFVTITDDSLITAIIINYDYQPPLLIIHAVACLMTYGSCSHIKNIPLCKD